MKILIIQTAFIGDIALSVFFANEIKQLFPNSSITFISTKIGCEILKCFEFIDNPVCFDKRKTHSGIKGLQKLVKEINNYGAFDYIFALHRSYRTGFLVSKIVANNKIGFDTSSFSFFFSKKIKYQKHIHEVLRNRNMLSVFPNIANNFNYKELVKNNIASFRFCTHLIEKQADKLVIIAPGSVWNTKKWIDDYFVSLAQMLKKNNEDVYLIGAEQEVEICNYIAEKSGAKSLANKTTIPQVLELIRNAKLVITNDSAPTHFASLFNIPTLTIFGATSPLFGFYPLADKSTSIEDATLFCRPCSIHGNGKCPRKSFDCMKNIKPDLIFDIAQKTLIDK